MIFASDRPPAALTRPVRIPVWALPLLLAAVAALAGTLVWQTVGDRGRPAIVRGTVTGVNSDSTSLGFTAASSRYTGPATGRPRPWCGCTA